MKRILHIVAALSLVGCGPSAKEQTVSIVNVEADRWQGGKDFRTTATDAFGHPLRTSVEKTTFNYVLEVRSVGPDGLPKNSDDIVETRTKPHGETTLTEQAAKTTEEVVSGAASGAVKGLKKGLGFGGDKK